MNRKPGLSVPDWLTLSRFFLAFLIMACIGYSFPFAKSLALILFIVGAITDFLDGHLARTVYKPTTFGKLMDPLADKVMVSAVLVALVSFRLPTLSAPIIPAILVVLIISREFMVTGIRLVAAGRGLIIEAAKLGKHKTAWQMIAIIVILLGLAIRFDIMTDTTPAKLEQFDLVLQYVSLALIIAATLITVVSGAHYFFQNKELFLEK